MSARVLIAQLTPFARRLRIQPPRRLTAYSTSTAGGLLRANAGLRTAGQRRWPPGASSLHILPAVRSISFARSLPKLALKLARIPALFGASAIAGLAYLQYQAQQAGTYAKDIFNQTVGAASNAAGTAYGGAQGIFEQTRRGWERTKQELEVPEWLRNILPSEEESSSRGGGGPNGPGGSPKKASSGAAVAGAATTAAFGYGSEDDPRSDEHSAKDDQMMMLTKKMIEIRGLLQTVGQSDALTLPSIVVIGSQSSGKSSVLEAIVGHEFLPKGSNMVTRRPIELTLVNTPQAHAEYGEFPALGLGKITDFSQIQKTLTDLNLAVPEKECVSDDPIQLRICSPNVPDLSLIDLPGYIQVSGADQPTELKQRITELCDKYIQPPNVILAISAADVDLANSTALRASRRIDPRGERTIGVITKMDLIEPERGASILDDKKYPLRLGYVGVVCKIPQVTGGLFSRGNSNITNAIVRNENAYFSSHPDEFGPRSTLSVGTTNLRKKLMHVLEQTMSASLATTGEAIHRELSEATYEYKVQYNERPLSAESYLAESLDTFKHSFKDFSDHFGRPEVRSIVKQELDQQVMNLLAQRYWNKPVEDLSPQLRETDPLSELPKADPQNPIWHLKLDASTASLTKLGIGRLATAVVANAVQTNVEQLLASSPFNAHPSARKAVTDASSSILKELSYDTSDELEICVKPYKYRIELDDAEWAKGREAIARALKSELKDCDSAVQQVENEIGGRKKLKDVLAFIDRARSGEIVLEGDPTAGAGGFSAALLKKGREAAFLRDRADILRLRLAAVQSRQCANKKNKYYCPEVFLDAVADKLTSTADLFLDAELLSKFYYNFPRELDARLSRGLSEADIERFAREDPKIRRHLEVVRRKELLEHVLKEMEALRQIEAREKRYGTRSTRASELGKEKGKGWSLF
ncbi:MAG: dynamin-like GTPase mgm1 [Bathelium mastoideum]|nr:MAG: dynamin-like GTPase mgm1 [Bathelium mastoideum]